MGQEPPQVPALSLAIGKLLVFKIQKDTTVTIICTTLMTFGFFATLIVWMSLKVLTALQDFSLI